MTESGVDLYHGEGRGGAIGIAGDQLLAGGLVDQGNEGTGFGIEIGANIFVLQIQITVIEEF